MHFVENYVQKLKSYDCEEIPEDLRVTIDKHISNIGKLSGSVTSYFKDQANQLIHIVPIIILTLKTIFDDIDYKLFSFENIQDKKLLPKGLAARLRNTQTKLDSIDESVGSLKNKVSIINDAHDAAESLPTDLASLKEAKQELEKLIVEARNDIQSTKDNLVEKKNEAQKLRDSTEQFVEDSKEYRNMSKALSDEAKALVEQCDDALQITTTQGLAAGFDQKATELKNSLWIWITGLLIALIAGGLMGAERVEKFTSVLENDLSAGQAILHTIMSIFSVGGPLWLAWISTQQINQRFKLSEDYSYKATVAKSFTGFKKFAERFDSSTEERLFNSTLDRLDEMPLRLVNGKDYNSPWHEFIDSEAFKLAMESVPTLAAEAGKFAGRTNLKNKLKKSKSTEIHES